MINCLITKIPLFLISLLFLLSCSVIRNQHIGLHPNKGNCNQQGFFTYSTKSLPEPLYEIKLDTFLLNHFSYRSLNAAHAIGILNLIKQLPELKMKNRTTVVESRLEALELKQKMMQKIHIASLEVSAVASEMDCEEERADQIAAYLKSIEDNSETRLTVAAIVIGSLGSMAAGALLAKGNDTNTPEFIGIGTGLAEAILGICILKQKRTVYFEHPRNALKDIWEAPATSEIFPPAIWYYLNSSNPGGEPSLREQIVNNWLGFGQLADTKEKKRESLYALFFGVGGKYTADQLINRANMYDQVEAQINLMKQDLQLLATEIEQLSEN